MKTLLIATRSILLWTLSLGLLYPLFVTGVGQILFPYEANGSLIKAGSDGKIISSELIAQPMTSLKYFHPRPSAVDYETLPSGASNMSLTDPELLELVEVRRKAYAELNGVSTKEVPSDALFASGSGLDPHISKENAMKQANRIAKANGVPLVEIEAIILSTVEGKTIIGMELVNVNKLNAKIALK